MRRYVRPILLALMLAIIVLGTSTAFARGNIKLGGVTFELGSLVAQGTVTGLANQDVLLQLDASGIPLVTCTNQGDMSAPGQYPPKTFAVGQLALVGDDPIRRNGTSPFHVETADPQDLDPIEYGCPNDNWTAEIDFVFWTNAVINVFGLHTGELFFSQEYICTTTFTSVTCTQVGE